MVLEWGKAFREFSPSLKQTDWYRLYLEAGEPTRTELMRLALLRVDINDVVLARAIGDGYGEARDGRLKLFDDAIGVLDKLYGKLPLGLITNGPADVQRQEVATLNIGKYFDSFFIEGELGFGKPDIRVFRMAEAAAGFSGQDILMIGNSFGHDIQAALDAGWQAVWIRRQSDIAPSRSAVEEMPAGSKEPTEIVGSLTEFLGLLDLG